MCAFNLENYSSVKVCFRNFLAIISDILVKELSILTFCGSTIRSHVDITSKFLNASSHVSHHIIEIAMKRKWSVLVIQFNKKVCEYMEKL